MRQRSVLMVWGFILMKIICGRDRAVNDQASAVNRLPETSALLQAIHA